MFDKEKIRFWIALAWITAFISLWMVTEALLPRGKMVQAITGLEQSIASENWEQASADMNQVDSIWRQNRYTVEFTNVEEQIYVFEHMLGQVRVLVENREKDAISLVGGLKQAGKILMSAHAGS